MKQIILIIDDSAPIRYLLETILGRKYTVVSANDGLAAMMWLSKGNRPDLIVSDIQMPNIDGVELVRFLSSNELYSDIPTILLSGRHLPDDEKDVLYKVTEFISKPFDPIKLMASVENAIKVSGNLVAAG